MQKRTKKHTWVAILLASAVSVGLLVLLLSDVDPARVMAEAKKVDPSIFVWIYATRAIAFFALTWRTRAIARPLHGYSWLQSTRAVFAGYFGNAILPARIGELMKVGYLARVGSPSPSACVAFVAVERVLDLVMISVIALFVSFIVLNEQAGTNIVLLAAGSGIGAALLVLLARSPSRVAEMASSAVGLLGSRAESLIAPRIERFLSGLSSLDNPRQVAPVILSTLLYWLANAATIAVWPVAFGFDLAWYAPLVVLVFLTLGTALPSTAAFVGTYHYAAAAGLHLMGVPREASIAMAFLVHAAEFIPWTIVAGLVIMVPLFSGQLASRPVPVGSAHAPQTE